MQCLSSELLEKPSRVRESGNFLPVESGIQLQESGSRYNAWPESKLNNDPGKVDRNFFC